MKLQLVSFEQAKTLKELGFPAEIKDFYAYDNKGELVGFANLLSKWKGIREDMPKELYATPTLELVAKWLREEKNLSLEPYRTACGWICMIVDIPSGTDKYQVGYNDDAGDDKSSGQFTTFELALSAGIDKAIEILK